MKIFDENGIEIESPDLEKGYLKNDRLLVMHHEAVEAVEEVGHFEVVAEYPNGGQDVEWVVDIPGVKAAEAWDEYEEILRYIPYTETELKLQAYERARQPLTNMEVLNILLAQKVNTLAVDDKTALRMRHLYPEWAAGSEYTVGLKVQMGGKLWRVIQAHTSQVGWEPENAPALWEQINETHSGTDADPIPYDGNMALVKGLHYYQGGKLYLCNRDTGVAVYHPLSELVGLYAEIVL
jgi:hypothetical protein